MRYTTRDAMHHSTAAHKVAACARQWPHAQRHLVAYGWCLAPNMAARAATASRDTRIAWHMDDACSTSMTARTAAASGCTWMVPCFESTAGLNQRLHSRWRHCVAHGASHRIMCCMACHAVRLGISASLHIYDCTHGGSIAWHMDGASPHINGCTHDSSIARHIYGASLHINGCTHGGSIAWHMDGASLHVNGCAHGGSTAWHMDGASLRIKSCTHSGSIAWHTVPRIVSSAACNAA